MAWPPLFFLFCQPKIPSCLFESKQSTLLNDSHGVAPKRALDQDHSCAFSEALLARALTCSDDYLCKPDLRDGILIRRAYLCGR